MKPVGQKRAFELSIVWWKIVFAKKRALRKERLLPFHNLVEDSLNIIPHILRYHGDRLHINRQ